MKQIKHSRKSEAQKCSIVHHSRELIHSNDYTTAQSLPRWRCGPAAFILAQQTFFQLLHIMDLRTVDPLLKDTPDAVVHQIQIWQIGWPHLWRDKLLASLYAAWWQCHVHGERHDFSYVNITSPGKGCTCTQCSKFTSMISIHLQSCVPKVIK